VFFSYVFVCCSFVLVSVSNNNNHLIVCMLPFVIIRSDCSEFYNNNICNVHTINYC